MTLIKERCARALQAIGFSADGLTTIGLVFAFYTGIFIFIGDFFAAGTCLTLSGLCDLMDGAVARSQGKSSVFGGILDSSLDRYGDAFIFGGALFLFIRQGEGLLAILSFSALIGSFAISYVRARTECEMENCRTGFWERGERITYIAMGLFVNNLSWAILVLGVATHWTAFQRLLYARNKGAASFIFSTGRKSRRYALKVVVLVLTLVLLRIN